LPNLMFLARLSCLPPLLNAFSSTWPAIAVGQPVTRLPPHRSRRAVFSHRALQEDSHPQYGSRP
jgi:hypothetical protein